MSAVIGALRVNLGLNSAQFHKGLGRANKGMGRFAKNAGIAMAGAAVAAAGGLAVLTRRSLSLIDEQAKLAQSLQTSTASVQVMARASELSGVGFKELEAGAIQLNIRLGKVAAGAGGPVARALKRMGLSAEALAALPLDERIASINEAIAEFIPAAQQGAIAGELFGTRNGIAIARLDPATIARATDEVERYGVAVSEVDAEAIERANDAVSALGLAGRGLGNQIAAILAPSMERIANLLAGWASKMGDVRVAIEGFLRPQTDLQIATDNLVSAMGDEITQSQILESVLGTSTRLSIDAAREKLSEALARNENVKAIIAEHRALALGSDEYAKLTGQINEYQAGLNAIGFPNNDAVARRNADAFEELQLSLASALTARQNLLKSDKDMSDQLARTDENIDTLTVALANAADGYVVLGGVLVEPIEGSERLTAGLGGVTGAAEDSADAIKGPLVGAVSEVKEAFNDWVARGFKDFKGFTGAVIGSFKSMLTQMIAIAAKNKIMIFLGVGGSGVGSTASAATSGSGLLGGVGATFMGSFGSAATAGTAAVAGTGLLGGLGGVGAGVASGFASGGVGGAVSGFFGSTAAGVSGGLAAGGMAGVGAAIGAALPVIGIGLALFSLFKKKKRKPPISNEDFAKIQSGLQLTGVELLGTGRAGEETAAALKKAAGGMKEFASQTEFYFDNFFTDTEKRQKALDALTGVFGKLNLEMPKSAKGFRDLIEGLDLTSKSGQSAYSELLKVAPVFTSVFGSIANAGEALNAQFGGDVFSTKEQMNRTMAALNRGAEIGSLPYGSGVVQLGEVVTVTERMDRLQGETAAASMSSAQTLAQIRQFFQRWDIDGMPEVRPA
ncbi:MAG: hypothetical protein COA53_06405 [Rhodobacteraceae bacterium]|nr:MAG: hypothetical protein COA53_06405 [Paracoccaceae bacterium]